MRARRPDWVLLRRLEIDQRVVECSLRSSLHHVYSEAAMMPRVCQGRTSLGVVNAHVRSAGLVGLVLPLDAVASGPLDAIQEIRGDLAGRLAAT
jgi:hypothetical protein